MKVLTLRRAVSAAVALVLAVGVGPVPAQAAPAADPQPPAPYSCPADPDAELAAALGAGHSVGDFLARWVPRLRGTAPVAGATLDAFLNRESLPAAIDAEGYHSLDEELKGCLISRLYDELDQTDPSFPHPSLSRDATLAMLYGFVFDNSWVKQFKQTDPPGDPTVVDNPIPVDPVDALLEVLGKPALPTLPAVSVPPELNPVPLVTKTAAELQSGLLNPVNQLFTNLGDLVNGIGVPVTLPGISLPTIDIAALINSLRRVIDSTHYRVCWTSVKTTVRQCSLDVPLGTTVPIDLAGDSRPDVTAQLVPLVNTGNPTNSLQVRWVVTRLPNLATGYSGPLEAHVFSVFTVPTADLELSIGSDGFASTLANRSEYVATLTDIQKAIAGETVIDVRAHHVSPGSSSAITYGVAPIKRAADDLGTGSTNTFDIGSLAFTPVPASTGLLTLNNPIEATLTVKAADLDGDEAGDERLGVKLHMPQPGVVLDARVLSKLPPAGEAECCPFRDLRVRVDALPTDVNLVVDSFPSKRTTDVTYDANATINRVDFTSTTFADTDGEYPAGADRNTFNTVSAQVRQLPTHVHTRFTTPDPATAAKTTDVHYDASAGIPHLEFASEEWAHHQASNKAVKQRNLLFTADTIPSVIDLVNTTTEVSPRNSTGSIRYAADGEVTNAHLQVADQIGVSELVADIASLPKAIVASYDTSSPADLDPAKAGCEDAGHTVLHIDGRTAADAPAGSSAFGQLTARYRSKVSEFLVPDAAIAPLQHAIVNLDPRTPDTCLDDTMQADLRYGGLRLLDAAILESGALSAVIRNDLEQKFVLQASQPDQVLTATVQNVPRQVGFAKTPVGTGKDRTKITYDGCTPSGATCTPRTIDVLKVRLDGKGSTGSFTAGEFVDATATTVPSHLELDLNLPEADGSAKSVAFDASGKTNVTAAVNKKVADLGTLSIAADVTGIPEHFDLSFGKDQPIVFSSGAGLPIDKIRAAVTNTGTAKAPETFAPHAYAKYIETPNAAPQLEATLGLANLQSFDLDPGGGAFNGTIKTTAPASPAPSPNSPFSLTADVRTLDTIVINGTEVPDNDLDKATVIKTGPAGAVLDPLPTSIVIAKTGGEQPDGTDTSALTIDTAGSAVKPSLSGDVVIGNPDSVADALAETLQAVQGANVGDGTATGEAGAVRLRLLLPVTPAKSVIRYGQITTKLDQPGPDPSFDVSGFGPLPGSKLDIIVNLDDKPAADRLAATIGVKGLAPALGFLRLFPINLKPNSKGDLDLDVRYAAAVQGADLDLDLSLGRTGSRPDKRVKVHTDAVPERVLFQARLGEPVAPDAARFHAEFRDANGALNRSPGHTTFSFQTPAADGADNPAAKVTLDLKDVPSLLDFAVKEAASTKSGNPDETCGLVESDFVLPTLTYHAEGLHQGDLDLSGGLDLAFVKPGSPKVVFDLVNLADGFTVTNTEEGKTFNLENPGRTTTKALVKVIPMDITLLHINWRGCAEPSGPIGWDASGELKVGVGTQLRLQVDDLVDVELKPGFSTGITGAFGNLALGLGNPTFHHEFSGGFGGGIFFKLSDSIKGTIPVFGVPDHAVSFPLPILFHVAKSTPGEWFDFNTHIPCVVPGFELIIQANIEPHRTKLELNQYSVPGGTWVVTPDPFGASAGLSILHGGIDIIDTIAGLFSSPYDHGVRAPSLDCEFFL